MQPQDQFDVMFCDLCNTSVPLQDLESGAAVRHLGKTIGACCRPALIGGSPPPDAAPAAATAAAPRVQDARLLPLGIAMLAAIAGATIFLDYRLTSADEHREKATTGLDDKLDANEEVLRGVSVAMDGLVRRTDFDGLAERLAAIDSACQRMAEQWRSSTELHGQALQRLQEQIRDAERSRPDYGPVLTELRQQLQQQAVALAELKAMPRAAEQAPAPPTPAPVEPAATGVPAALQHHIKRLQDEDAATRFEAVDELLRSRDPAMLVHLLPMAKDSDTFVRRLTVEGLRDFRNPSAVDALLVALADPEEIVRDTAWRSLKELTGQKFPFEATAARDVRARAQAKWQEWWEKNRDSFGS